MFVKVARKVTGKRGELDVKVEPQGLLERNRGVMWLWQNVTGVSRGSGAWLRGPGSNRSMVS